VCFLLLLMACFKHSLQLCVKIKFLPHKVHMCNRETNCLILFKEVIIYYENLMQHISSLYGKMQSFLMLQEMVCHITFGSYNRSY